MENINECFILRWIFYAHNIPESRFTSITSTINFVLLMMFAYDDVGYDYAFKSFYVSEWEITVTLKFLDAA